VAGVISDYAGMFNAGLFNFNALMKRESQTKEPGK
jgi:hypothetical protein